MSKELIIRANTDNDFVECGYRDNFGNVSFKKMKTKKFIDTINHLFKKDIGSTKKLITLFENGVIGADDTHVLINQPGHKKIVTYTSSPTNSEILTFRINFPNALYIIHQNTDKTKIIQIECYAYKTFNGEETELYEYPMPNELSGNRICIGTADKSINDGKVIEALERIIFTPYSHARFSGINGFSETIKYFEYLENNEFPYKLMKSLNKKLKDILEG